MNRLTCYHTANGIVCLSCWLFQYRRQEKKWSKMHKTRTKIRISFIHLYIRELYNVQCVFFFRGYTWSNINSNANCNRHSHCLALTKKNQHNHHHHTQWFQVFILVLRCFIHLLALAHWELFICSSKNWFETIYREYRDDKAFKRRWTKKNTFFKPVRTLSL